MPIVLLSIQYIMTAMRVYDYDYCTQWTYIYIEKNIDWDTLYDIMKKGQIRITAIMMPVITLGYKL